MKNDIKNKLRVADMVLGDGEKLLSSRNILKVAINESKKPKRSELEQLKFEVTNVLDDERWNKLSRQHVMNIVQNAVYDIWGTN